MKTAPNKKAVATKPAIRFVKLSTTGKELAPTAKSWAQVLDRETGLIWMADTLGAGARYKWTEAKAAAEAVRIGKHADWRLPTIKELLSLVDYARLIPRSIRRSSRLSRPGTGRALPTRRRRRTSRGSSASATATPTATAGTARRSSMRCAPRAPVSNGRFGIAS